MAEKRFAGLMLLSWFVPVVGGVATYLLRKDDSPELARVLLAGTFVVPVQIFAAAVADALGLHYLFIGLPLAFVITYALIRTWRGNPYSQVLWAFYFGVVGAIYAYYWPYREEEVARRSVGRFAVGWVLIYIVLASLLGALGSYMWMQSQVPPPAT